MDAVSDQKGDRAGMPWASPVLLISRTLGLTSELQATGQRYQLTTVCCFDAVRRRIDSYLWRAVVIDAVVPPAVSADRLGRVLECVNHGTPILVWGGDTRYGRVLSQVLDGGSRPWRALDPAEGVEGLLEGIGSLGAS